MPTESFDATPGLSFERRLAQSAMAELYGVWTALGGGTAPRFRDFDPMAVPRHLANLQVTRREASGRHRIGLTGENIVTLAGANNTGKYLDEVMPAANYPSRAALYGEALDTGRPIAYRSFLVLRGREHCFQKRLLLPFIETGPAPDLVLAMALTVAVPPDRTPTVPADGIVEILRVDPGA